MVDQLPGIPATGPHRKVVEAKRNAPPRGSCLCQWQIAGTGSHASGCQKLTTRDRQGSDWAEHHGGLLGSAGRQQRLNVMAHGGEFRMGLSAGECNHF
jgi:hypothetical protein